MLQIVIACTYEWVTTIGANTIISSLYNLFVSIGVVHSSTLSSYSSYSTTVIICHSTLLFILTVSFYESTPLSTITTFIITIASLSQHANSLFSAANTIA